MNSKEIANFRRLGDMILPSPLSADNLRHIDDYGDYALLTYTLAEPVPVRSALDDMEDNMDLNVLYHVEMVSATTRGEHCCAYCVPVNGKMYKINAQSRPDRMLDTLYVYIYDSLEVMLEALKTDLIQHTRGQHVLYAMDMARLVADFM